jgi:hypothetical protein
MAKTKISEFDVDPANNTDINSINIAEGCAPSGINNAIRQLMSDLKEFQTGGGGDPFNGAVNGTVGATTPSTAVVTTLTANTSVSTDLVNEKTSGSGVTVDGVLIKDSAVSASSGFTQSNTFNSASTFGFKNRIINGAMMIDQYNNGSSVSLSTSGGFAVDRFTWNYTTAIGATLSAQQVTDAPSGFVKSYKLTVTTGATASGTTSASLFHKIEGNNITDLAWGTASASPVTVSFWVKSSLTGTFGGALLNGTLDRSYPFTYNISAANTWEYKTVTILGDTSGTWETGTSTGIHVSLDWGSGSGRSGTSGAWVSARAQGVIGATSIISNTGATWQVTGVQLEKGSTATSFDYRPYGTELALCQRYLPYFSSNGSTMASLGIGQTVATTASVGVVVFPVQTRVPPTGITISSAGHFSGTQTGGSQSAYTGLIFNVSNVLCSEVYGTGASGLAAAGGASNLRMNNASAYIYFTGCEL